MKKIYFYVAGIAALLSLIWIHQLVEKPAPAPGSREEYEAYLRTHQYTEWLREGAEEEEGEEGEVEARPDRPDLAFMQDYLRTMDPNLKRPVPEVLYELSRYTAQLRDGKLRRAGRTEANSLAEATVWEERGPSEVGGRTRAILFDPADPEKKKVWAGGVSGGLWFNNDITDENSSWIKVNDFWDNLSISCIAADPNNAAIIYVGTGESHTDMRGAGIWKTTDNGITWNRLTSTENFYQIRDIAVRNENGTSVVYAAVHLDYGDDNPPDNAGLYRSANGGTSWTQVLPSTDFGKPHTPTDIELGDDEIWVGAQPSYSNAPTNSIIYKSTTGTGGWTRFDLTVRGQVELGVSPSDPDVVYAILEDETEGSVSEIIKTTNNGGSWTSISKPVDADDGIPTDDYTRGQAWYDLSIAIHPTNPNEVIVGGVDLFRTTNGGTSWSQLSKWWSGIATTAPIVHADQHEILYRPGFPGQAIFGNDGGIYFSANLNAGTSSASAEARNKNYNVTQFYSGAIHPVLANYMLGGAQDNGTQKFTLPGFGSTEEAQGGDGAMCFIDQLTPSIQIVSYVYNDVSISKDGGVTFNQLIDDANSGHFINVEEYDFNQKFLYTAKTATSLYKVKVSAATPTVKTLSIPAMGSMATALRVSPYTTTQSNLYVGTEAGRLFKVVNAGATTPVITEITGASFPNGSVSGIAFGADENQMLVTFSNYGVISIWETRDGGSTWQNKEGNLKNMPVRWVEYHPQNFDQAYIATELGVWSCDDLTAASPAWNATNGGLANVRTDMLRIRKGDNSIMAATFGRGIFTALIPSQLAQTISFDPLPTKTFLDSDFTLSASSTSNLPVSFSSSNTAIASISGDTVKIKGAGTVTITAMQPGNVSYKAADVVEQTLVINKAAQTITFGSLPDHDVDEDPFTLIATTTSGLPVSFTSSNTAVAIVTGNTLTIKGVGTTTITATQTGNNNYLAAASVPRELTIQSRIIDITGELIFGESIILEEVTNNFTISNSGTASLTLSNVNLPEGYSIDPEVNNTVIDPGNELQFTITFAPVSEKDYNGVIEVISNATSGTNTISVAGTGVLITAGEHGVSTGIELFPNPVEDWLVIKGNNLDKVATVSIADEKGATTQFLTEPTDNGLRVNVSLLSKGVYIIAVPLNGKIYNRKFSKE